MVGALVPARRAGGGKGNKGRRGGGREVGLNVVKEAAAAAEGVTWMGVFGARDHCGADITTASPKITNILERRSSPVIKDGAYEDIT